MYVQRTHLYKCFSFFLCLDHEYSIFVFYDTSSLRWIAVLSLKSLSFDFYKNLSIHSFSGYSACIWRHRHNSVISLPSEILTGRVTLSYKLPMLATRLRLHCTSWVCSSIHIQNCALTFSWLLPSWTFRWHG